MIMSSKKVLRFQAIKMIPQQMFCFEFIYDIKLNNDEITCDFNDSITVN